ncbi:c-type cytochrome (plasmid) [Nitratireductor sp. GISD-1A_MAKvit]|uniref:c-type cytochrome n=1 Tax=Nitratireductor sp. GISD-1A_MAKvit TaxID=3234198 RepID=UPI0034656C8C
MFLSSFRLGLIASALTLATPALAVSDAQIADADIARGEKVFKRCAACHTVEQGGKNKVGPNLFGIVGGPVGQVEGYKYSPAFKKLDGNWDVERLDAFLLKPKAAVKGTKMAFAGLRKEQERIDLIGYLNTFSDAPIEFGAAAETEKPAEKVASAEAEPDQGDEQAIEGDFGNLKVAPGVDTTFYACTACHSEMIIAQQGLTREGWDEMLEWMVEEQGMDEIEEPDRTAILDYLATHYNEDRPNFPSAN